MIDFDLMSQGGLDTTPNVWCKCKIEDCREIDVNKGGLSSIPVTLFEDYHASRQKLVENQQPRVSRTESSPKKLQSETPDMHNGQEFAKGSKKLQSEATDVHNGQKFATNANF